MKIISAIILMCFYANTICADNERIFINAKINDQPVNLIFDTGTSDLVLFSNSANRLGLKIDEYTNSTDKTIFEATEECSFTMLDTTVNTRFNILNFPSYIKLDASTDGFLGWSAISNNVVLIDAVAQAVFFFPDTPTDMTTWTRFSVKANSDTLILEIPNGKHKAITIAIDTGSFFGIELNQQNWREWKSTHTNQPSTIENDYTRDSGWRTKEESWAHKISMGSLSLTDLPVIEASSTNYDATLGLTALKRMDIVVDGKHGVAFVRPKNSPPSPYQHNRLGADFALRNSQSDDLVARVADGSPAYQAGIRNGDVLLAIDGRDETKWRTDTNSPVEVSAIEKPAGTKLELTLKRGDKIFKTTAILQNILPPDAPKNSN